MSRERRLDERISVSLPIELSAGARKVHAVTADVSYRGLFARMEHPLALRQFVRIEATLPPGYQPFQSHGMVVYVADGSPAKSRGIGVQFYAMGQERRAWEEFVRRARTLSGVFSAGSRAKSEPPIPQQQIDELRLLIRTEHVNGLLSLYLKHINRGGLIVPCDWDLNIGVSFTVDVIHPDSGDCFEFTACVRQILDEGRLNLEFLGLDEDVRDSFLEFVIGADENLLGHDFRFVEGADGTSAHDFLFELVQGR